MSKHLVLAFVALAAATFDATAAGLRRNANPIPNSYIVVLKDTVAVGDVERTAKSLAKAHGGRVTGVMKTAIKAFGFHGNEQRALALSLNPNVAFVEEDAFLDFSNTCTTQNGVTTCTYADDERWALDRIDQKPKINTDRSFSYTRNGSGVRAYVVDSGVRGSHQEFGGRVEEGANMTWDPEIADAKQRADEEDPIPLDSAPANNPCNGSIASTNSAATHGTAVASVLGGSTTGIARGVTIVPVKVASCYTDSNGVQRTKVSMLATARGLDWILTDVQSLNAKAVVNISLRFVLIAPDESDYWMCEDGNGGYVNCMAAIESVVSKLVQNKIPVVVAAGNDEWHVSNDGISQMGYGGTYSTYKTITVGGTMYDPTTKNDIAWKCDSARDTVGEYSCDRNKGSNFGAAVSIWAPAWNVLVASGFDDTGYRAKGSPSSGTSFAAPLVAGAVARILQKYEPRAKTVDEIWTELSNLAAQDAQTPDFDQDANVYNNKLLYMGRHD